MIKILENNGNSAPILICDICGERINNAREGAAVFGDKASDKGVKDVKHVHKASCHDMAEIELAGEDNWQEMSQHLRLLLHNVGLTPKDLDDEGKTDRDFGLTNE